MLHYSHFNSIKLFEERFSMRSLSSVYSNNYLYLKKNTENNIENIKNKMITLKQYDNDANFKILLYIIHLCIYHK